MRKGYDYWALGHVHAHEVLHRAPWVVFPGNTQGRHIRETGRQGRGRGGVEGGVVSRDSSRAARRGALARVDARRSTPTTASTSSTTRPASCSAARATRPRGACWPCACVVDGATRAHADVAAGRDRVVAELRARALDFGDALWLEKVELRTRPAVALDELRASEGFVGELLRAVAEARHDPVLAAELRAQLQPLVDKLGEELQGERRRRPRCSTRWRRSWCRRSSRREDRPSCGSSASATSPTSRCRSTGAGASGLRSSTAPTRPASRRCWRRCARFLFGFPRGAAWDFRWPADTLAVGGTLAFADGAIAELRREKKRGLKGKLGDEALTDELLRARLGRPSAEMFSTVFAFSLEDLARGGEALRDEGCAPPSPAPGSAPRAARKR